MTPLETGCEAYHLRILFGPLFGTNITLANREIFFCVGDQKDQYRSAGDDLEHSLHRADNTLYIPFRESSPNFRIRIASPERENIEDVDDIQHDENAAGTAREDALPTDFHVDYLSADICETVPGRFNQVCRFGEIAFALKPESDTWSEEVAGFISASAADTSFAEDKPADTADDTRGDCFRFAAKVCAVLVCCCACMGVAYWKVQQYVRAQKVASIASLLAHAPTQNHVLPGNDGKIYVLAQSQDGTEWDKQVVLKATPSERIEVASLPSERARLERILDAQGAGFVTVRMDTPERPLLILSTAVSAAARVQAIESLRRATPYATGIDTQYASVRAIELEALQGLAKAGVRYRRLSRAHGATFEVAGALTDGELAALQDLVSSFGQKWGAHCVDFKIAMRTDWLKGKSYREGGEGYVLLDHASWYFPQPMKGYSR